MSKRRNRVTTLQDIARLPVTEVGNKSGFQTRREFYKEQEQIAACEQKAAEEKLMAPVRAVEKQFREESSKQSAKVKSFFSKSLSVIDDNIENAPVDFMDYPEGPRDPQAESAAGKEFEQIIESSGCTLTDAGWIRLGHYLGSLRLQRGVSFASASSWAAALDRLFSLGCFAAGEITGYESSVARRETPKTVTPEPSATPTWDAVSTLSTERREERKKVLDAVGEDFTSEVAAFVGLWLDQLARDYNYYMPDAITKRALQYVTDQNLNPLRHETWNIVRRVFTKNGWMLKPDGTMMLTEREKLSDLCDTSDLSDRETRRRINLKNRELLDSEPAYAPHKYRRSCRSD
jgi:hypothetical protein